MRGLLASAQAGTCGTSISFIAGWELRKTCDTGNSKMQLETPIPHLDAGKLQRTAPEQRRIGLERLEITADRDRFRDHRAVVENERRHALERVNRGIGRRHLLHGAEIDLLHGQRDTLLGQKDPRAPRIGRAASVVKLHLGPRAARRPTLSSARPPRKRASGRGPWIPVHGNKRRGVLPLPSRRLHWIIHPTGCIIPSSTPHHAPRVEVKRSRVEADASPANALAKVLATVAKASDHAASSST